MKIVVVDKIASVAQAQRAGPELRLSARHPVRGRGCWWRRDAQQQVTYNTLELTSRAHGEARRSGDIVVGALGHRKALLGYAGHLPDSLAVGDMIQMLNIGGVLGICRLRNPDKGQPFDCRVLGAVLQFPVPRRAHRRTGAGRLQALDFNAPLDTRGVPVVALAGTCMDAGKTAAACAIVSRMRHRGLVVDAFKATGVSLRRDILAMEDAGARRSMIFTDLGVVTTTPRTGLR